MAVALARAFVALLASRAHGAFPASVVLKARIPGIPYAPPAPAQAPSRQQQREARGTPIAAWRGALCITPRGVQISHVHFTSRIP